MSERITKLQRWLDLIAALVGRRVPVTVEELMERVPAYARRWRSDDETARASVRRAFERDKDELRQAGIPIETVTFRINYGKEEVQGYRLARKDFYLPYLRLLSSVATDEGDGGQGRGVRSPRPDGVPEFGIASRDAAAAFEALDRVAGLPGFPYRSEARSARRKLAFDLDPEALRRTPLLYVDRPGGQEVSERVRLLAEALLARKRVTFRYHGIYRGRTTRRDVAPWGLLFQGGHWYLVGHDATREEVRIFRVGRMEEASANPRAPHTPDYQIPAGFNLDAYRGRRAWELGADDGPPLGARVRFDFPASLWAARNGYGELEAREPGGSSVRLFEVTQVPPFLRWVLSLEGEAEVVGPPELRAEMRSLARRVAALYGAGEGGAGADGGKAWDGAGADDA